MSRKDGYSLYIGSKAGTFRGLRVDNSSWSIRTLQNFGSSTDSNEITALAWGDDDENEILLACGAKSTTSVKVYDRNSSSFTCSFFCDCGAGRITGLSRYDGAILTAQRSGDIKLWKYQDPSTLFNAGENLEKMCHSKINRNLVATGGQDNSLKLIDLETTARLFLGKNVRNDKFDMEVPIWISDVAFLPSGQEIVTVERYGQVALYDPKSQRRPVVRIEMQTQALSTLSTTYNDKQILVGSTRGRVHLMDMRKPPNIVHTYPGFTGGITGLASSKKAPQVISISLDRYLRVHHMHTKKLLHEVYLTSRLTCMLLRSNFRYPETVMPKVQKEVDSSSDSELDMVFEKMQKVDDKENKNETGRKRERSVSEKSAMKADNELSTTSKQQKK